jgi:hypothetical protein
MAPAPARAGVENAFLGAAAVVFEEPERAQTPRQRLRVRGVCPDAGDAPPLAQQSQGVTADGSVVESIVAFGDGRERLDELRRGGADAAKRPRRNLRRRAV